MGNKYRSRNNSRPMSAKDMERLIRRVRRSTLSVRIAKSVTLSTAGDGDDEDEEEEEIDVTDERYQKFLRRLARPTTASSLKCFCPFCSDPKTADYLDRDYTDDRLVDKEELEEIINRLQKPTIASEGGQGYRCNKRKESSSIDRKAIDQRPLVCGLPRSRTVDEIVSRLHPNYDSTKSKDSSNDQRERKNEETSHCDDSEHKFYKEAVKDESPPKKTRHRRQKIKRMPYTGFYPEEKNASSIERRQKYREELLKSRENSKRKHKILLHSDNPIYGPFQNISDDK